MRPLSAVPLALLLLLSAPGSSGEEPRRVLGKRAEMTVERVALDPKDPSRRTAGALSWRGGIRLRSPDPAFGGFSAMQVSGDRFTLVSDGGNIVRFRMGADWRPREIVFGDLPGPGDGRAKYERDAESLTSDPATGRLWIGFEGANAIWRYDSLLRASDAHVRPRAMRGWAPNGGPEALTRLPDGGFVVIAEREMKRGLKGRAAIRFAGDPVAAPQRGFRFRYLPPAGYDPSDMTLLPDGRLLVLNRRVSVTEWFTAKLVLVDPAMIRPGALVEGREIAAIVPPMTRDNFEAIAVTREGGATILWLATDDNREWFEQSLLMKFRLDLPAR